MLADQMFFIALMVLVVEMPGSGLQLGSVLAVTSVSGAALMLVGGWLSAIGLEAVFLSAGASMLLAVLAGISSRELRSF